MFILTSLTLPLAALTAFSRIGVSWRHGPHHGAQKSIRTGWRFDSSMTSFTNVWVVVSLIRSAAACGAGPLPCSTMVTISSPDVSIIGPVLARPGAMVQRFPPVKWRAVAEILIGAGPFRARAQ